LTPSSSLWGKHLRNRRSKKSHGENNKKQGQEFKTKGHVTGKVENASKKRPTGIGKKRGGWKNSSKGSVFFFFLFLKKWTGGGKKTAAPSQTWKRAQVGGRGGHHFLLGGGHVGADQKKIKGKIKKGGKSTWKSEGRQKKKQHTVGGVTHQKGECERSRLAKKVERRGGGWRAQHRKKRGPDKNPFSGPPTTAAREHRGRVRREKWFHSGQEFGGIRNTKTRLG